jgi:hypothetical protein
MRLELGRRQGPAARQAGQFRAEAVGDDGDLVGAGKSGFLSVHRGGLLLAADDDDFAKAFAGPRVKGVGGPNEEGAGCEVSRQAGRQMGSLEAKTGAEPHDVGREENPWIDAVEVQVRQTQPNVDAL